MSTKKKAPGSAATLTGAGQEKRLGVAAVPETYDTTAAAARQIQISDFLLHGAGNALPRRHLRQLTGLTDRELRRRIQEERLSGAPILADNRRGYFLPADDSERMQFIQSMRSRAREIDAVATAVEGAEDS